MLAVAKQKSIYDQLVEAEIVEFLRAEQRQFDLVIAGDVFVYLGKLDECFQQIKRILRPGQWLSFSLESSPDADVELGAELRYSHSDRYIANAAAAHSFRVVSSEYCQVRTQGKVGVDGRVVLLQAI
jgi:predicted TPR repeat methyltransferase